MTPLRFAAHLFAVAAALGAALVLFQDRASNEWGRAAGGLGFLALAAGEAVTGAAFYGELATLPAGLRTAGYALLLLGAVPALGRSPDRLHSPVAAALAVGALPVALPAGVAGAAAVAEAWRRRRTPGVIPLAAGLAFLAASEAALEAAPESALALRVVGYVGAALFVIRAVRSSIRLRFAAAMVGLLVVVVIVAFSVVASVLGQNIRAAALDRVARMAEEAQARLEPLAAEDASTLVVVAEAEIPRFRRGEPFPPAGMRSLKDNLFPRVDFIVFLSKERRVLGRAGISAEEAVEVSAVPVVRFSLRGGADVASLDTLGRGRLALIGAAAVRDGVQILGVVVTGYFAQTLIERVAPGSLSAIFYRAEPVPVAANDPAKRRPRLAVDGAALRGVWEAFLSGAGPIRQSLVVGGAETFAALRPLRRADGQPVGILLVAERAGPVAATERDINRLLFAATMVLFGLAFLLAALVARRITRPVISLTGAARRVATGELGAKADVGGEDEVGVLAEAFNQMTESLALSDAQLREAAQEETRLRGRLETVVNSMGDGLVAVDDQGRVVTYNPAAATILGRSRGNVLGKPVERVVEVRDADGRVVPLGQELRRGTAFVERADGKLVPVAIVSSPLRDTQGRPFGQVLVLRDMTREHEVERMKTEFLTSVSHELRTPLTPIIGYSEILSGREVPAERVKQFADSMLASAHRLERIVAMLLDFAAMEGGRMTIAAEPTALRPLVSKAVEEWRGRTDRHEFVTRFDPSLPQALIDVSLMRRAIDEVLDNAVKYSPHGGTVTVSLSPENAHRRRMLRLDVSDEGIGIESDDLPRIFDDFRQLDASDTRSFGGLGLGLAFVKRIIDAHRGTISAKSVPGEGTTFSLLIPTADTERGRGTAG
ncbi:MAG TPA: ATP-binding protein [Actinomycetota bacterium]|nr:ATP-binding protein [Actinomycetota bacterium]